VDTVVVATVEVPVTTKVLVVVLFVVVRFVMKEVTALRSVEKRLVAVNPDEDALASDVCPETVSSPPTTAAPDVVILVADALERVV
jgi:hypothetical protein